MNQPAADFCDTEPAPANVPQWRKPSQAQRLSKRVILRAQELADELRDDLNTLSFFRGALEKAEKAKEAGNEGEDTESGKSKVPMDAIEGVVFVCPDLDDLGFMDKRYYLLRLLRTFDFSDDPLWEWVAGNVERFWPLFGQDPDSADFQNLQTAVDRARSEDNEALKTKFRGVVHDILIDQIAELPYRGILPELWEKFFGMDDGHLLSADRKPRACWFELEEIPEERRKSGKKQQTVGMWDFTEFKGFKRNPDTPELRRPLPDVEIDESDIQKKHALEALYRDFIDPFILGAKPLNKPVANSPYIEGEVYSPLSGIALPVYDSFPREGLNPCGSFIAWLAIIPRQDQALLNALFPENPGTPEDSATAASPHNSWLGLSFCLRKFATRLRQLQRSEALEHRSGWHRGALELTRDRCRCFTGWRRSDDKWQPQFPNGEFYVHEKKGGIHRLAVDVTPTLGMGLDHRGAPLPVLLENRSTTIVPEDPRILQEYLLALADAIRAFHRDASRLEAERRFGKLSGELSSAHDYSKDIGSACLKMREFNKSLEQAVTAILEQSRRLAVLPEPAPGIGATITGELNRIEAPRMDWFASVQFTHAHLRTQTIGPVQDEPAECVAMIETGTLRSIYELVWTLVWHRQQAESLPTASAEKLSNPLTWAALFRYDMEPTEATMPFHEKLGRRIQEMVREQKMTGADFLNRFPVPEINPGSRDFDAPLLWGPGDKERWEDYKPIERLLPLLVFSLRFAFQCAWAKTLLEGHSGQREPVRLSADSPVGRTRRIEIAFAAPDSDHRGRLEGIPYFMEWRRQMGHYTGRTYPWKDVGTDSVTLDQRTNLIFLSLTASV